MSDGDFFVVVLFLRVFFNLECEESMGNRIVMYMWNCQGFNQLGFLVCGNGSEIVTWQIDNSGKTKKVMC